MKKKLLLFILICIIIIVIKYRFSNYKITYNIKSYDIIETYKNKRFYFEINKGNNIYNFDVYSKRKFSKTRIKKIIEINDDNFNCIYPVIDGIKTYPLCYMDNEYVNYNLIESEKLDSYKKTKQPEEAISKDFEYFNNLDNEYVALWNYKGYIIMHNSTYKNVDLFKNDRYDNSLAYLIGNTIYSANYDEEHEYSTLIALNITNNSYTKINIGYKIDYDSYIVGNIKNYLYIFDNKHSILYEINLKKGKTNIIGNNEIGFVKYEDGEFVSCSKSEYKVNKITINTAESNYKYNINNGIYKSIKENNKLFEKISNYNAKIINEQKNSVYYIFEDNFYKYDPINGEIKIFYNYELTFNSDNTIFMYYK